MKQPKQPTEKARAAHLQWGARLKAYNEEAKLVRAGFLDLRCTGFRDVAKMPQQGPKRIAGVATFNDQIKRRFRFSEAGLTLFTPDPDAETAISPRLDELQRLLDTL